jgi:hypothetical protein
MLVIDPEQEGVGASVQREYLKSSLLIAAGVMLFPPVSQPKLFSAYILAVSAVLVAICWLTGEPPRWRWGHD